MIRYKQATPAFENWHLMHKIILNLIYLFFILKKCEKIRKQR